VNANPLCDPVNYATRTGTVRIQPYAQAQVIPKKLRAENLERCADVIRDIRKQRRNYLVKKLQSFRFPVADLANSYNVP
jgi:DNA polymerase elongation subunit (family B)